MIVVVLLSILAPLSIYIGLVLLNSAPLTFLFFYGGVCLVIPFIDLKLVRKYPINKVLQSLGFKYFKKSFSHALLLGLFYLIFIFLFFHALEDDVLNINAVKATLAAWNFNREYVVLFLFIMIFANSILEEIYWRGYVFFRLQEKLDSRQVIVLTSLFYASYHLITTINLFSVTVGLIFSMVIFGIGLFWGFLRQRYDSIYVPMISHLMADLGIMLIYLKFIY